MWGERQLAPFIRENMSNAAKTSLLTFKCEEIKIIDGVEGAGRAQSRAKPASRKVAAGVNCVAAVAGAATRAMTNLDAHGMDNEHHARIWQLRCWYGLEPGFKCGEDHVELLDFMTSLSSSSRPKLRWEVERGMDKLVNMCFQADFPLSDTFGVTGSQVEAVINAVFSEGEGATQEVRNEIAFAAIERTMWLRGCVYGHMDYEARKQCDWARKQQGEGLWWRVHREHQRLQLRLREIYANICAGTANPSIEITYQDWLGKVHVWMGQLCEMDVKAAGWETPFR